MDVVYACAHFAPCQLLEPMVDEPLQNRPQRQSFARLRDAFSILAADLHALFAIALATFMAHLFGLAPCHPPAVAGVSFITMMRETIFEKNMTSLLSRRSLALNIAVAIGALAFGFLLEQVAFPLNYQIMFFVAYGFALLSLWHITRIRVVVNKPVMPPQSVIPRRQSAWRSPNFRSVALMTALTHVSFTVIAPIMPLFLVRRLGADEGFMALFALLELGAGALVSLFTPRIAKRLGNRALIALAMIGTAGAALLIAFAPSLNFTLLGAALSGASWTAAASVGLMAYFMERTPAAETASYSTAFHQIIGLSMFIGPMLGSLLASGGFDLLPILIIGALMRVGAGAMIEFSSMQGRRAAKKPLALGD